MTGLCRQALAMSACAVALAAAKPAEALTFDLFLISTPTVASSSETAPMTVNLSSVYQLTINFAASNGPTATGFVQVSDFTFDVDQSLSYANHIVSGAGIEPHDAGESGQGTAAHYDAQISTWDDVGITNADEINESADAGFNIDFGRNASVIFDAVSGGYTDLLIAEDGGFNPFDMSLCSDADCTTETKIFNGFNGVLSEALAALPDFTPADSTDASETDQAFLFRFDRAITEYLKITEDDFRNFFTGQRLEVDFVGVGGTAMAPVPGPAGLPLVLTSLGAMIWFRRRKAA